MSKRVEGYGLIDRTQPLDFRFDGRKYSGFAGDTVASALVASGVRILGRGFKYHRPRGLWGAWTDDPSAIMNIRLGAADMPNCPAAATYLEHGMTARAVNTWPSASFDLKGGLDLFHRFLGAGFYYKTFIWPDWHLFEPAIRKMAGLGSVSPDTLADYQAKQTHDHCDTLMIGGGAAGLAAARAAAEAGQDVVLVDDQQALGGSVYQIALVDGMTPAAWVQEYHHAIVQAGGRVLTRTTAYGVYDHGLIGLVTTGRLGTAPALTRMRAGRVVLATGAYDRPLTFAENDRPGIMALTTAAELLARYGVRVGRRLAVVANHTAAEAQIALLEGAGATVTRIDPNKGPLTAFAGRQVTGLRQGNRKRVFDAVLTTGGLTPVVHLWRHAGGTLAFCNQRQAFLPDNPPDRMVAVGAANGTFDLDAAVQEAIRAGRDEPHARPASAFHLTPLWPDITSTGRQWIDIQHDVTLKDVKQSHQENYVSVEHLKRYTTLGMASDQGKTANMAGLAAMAALQGKTIPEVGTTTFRPPFVPIPLETYRGHRRGQHWQPLKRLPLEPRHRAIGAALGEYGGWLRPGWYGDGDPKTAVAHEVRQARTGVGLFDGSPLGKIEVMGPDAETFLNFVYYNTMQTLKPGHIRYGFMLSETGVVFDDGVLTRIGPDHFIVSCSSSHVDSVRRHLEAWRQDGHEPDRIFIHDATQTWATITVTGPRARAALGTLQLDLDLGAAAFPHMQIRETTWRGKSLRIARVSFSGDLSYELSIPASAADTLWTTLAQTGATPVGLEAMLIMRAEKGYIVIGKDTDGETMPHDLGVTGSRSRKTAAYLGDRSLQTEVACAQGRKQLVGIATEGSQLPTGAHVVHAGQSQGYVTSSYHSPTLGKPIALGLVSDGLSRIGEAVGVWHLGQSYSATLCAPCVFDPAGERLNA